MDVAMIRDEIGFLTGKMWTKLCIIDIIPGI